MLKVREKSKSAWFFAAVSSLVSTSVGQGNYSEAVNVTLNPGTVEQVMVFSETVGWYIASLLAVPFGFFVLLGFLNGDYERESFWEMVILSFLFTLIGYVALMIFLLKF